MKNGEMVEITVGQMQRGELDGLKFDLMNDLPNPGIGMAYWEIRKGKVVPGARFGAAAALEGPMEAILGRQVPRRTVRVVEAPLPKFPAAVEFPGTERYSLWSPSKVFTSVFSSRGGADREAEHQARANPGIAIYVVRALSRVTAQLEPVIKREAL